jgi:hypothetical protein
MPRAGSGVSISFSPQGPKSLTANYAGTIKANVTANSIKFTGGGADALPTGKWKPTTKVKSEYGAIVEGLLVTDIANLELSLTSPKAIHVGSNGSFSPATEHVTATKGTITLGSTKSKQTLAQSLVGLGANNASKVSSTLTAKNGIMTLTITASATLNYKLESFTVPVKLDGTLVATAKA